VLWTNADGNFSGWQTGLEGKVFLTILELTGTSKKTGNCQIKSKQLQLILSLIKDFLQWEYQLLFILFERVDPN